MSAVPVRFPVPGSLHGSSLHEFLVRRTGFSGKKVKGLLDARSVFVNGRRTWMARHPLQAGDTVEFIRPPESGAPRDAASIPVLWQDESYLIVNKPPGYLSEGRDGIEGRADSEHHLWAVHRLDRETSGCLLLARRPEGRDAMIPVFADRQVEKIYHAISVGRFPRGVSRIDRAIDGQSAVTRVLHVQQGRDACLLELAIETGRTHQIRRHLTSTGHPVLGDKSYGTGWEANEALRAVPRQMLHASRLAFPHPVTGDRVEVRAPWPADFAQWARRLGLSGAPPARSGEKGEQRLPPREQQRADERTAAKDQRAERRQPKRQKSAPG